MAHKKGKGSSKNGRDSQSKRLGTKFRPGVNVGMGNDFTIYAKIDGEIKFEYVKKGKQQISVYPA